MPPVAVVEREAVGRDVRQAMMMVRGAAKTSGGAICISPVWDVYE